MCGIAGIATTGPQTVDLDLIRRMTRSLAHRGPNGEGVHVEPGVALGHRRLSIIDLSEAASQPLPNEDETVWVTFNGEIYNFVELRERLVAAGHRFRSHTDSEVLVHLYEERGLDMLEDLRGMFAFAIWDRAKKRLFVARDRVGIKPLFYCEHEGTLRFGSEIKALLVDPAIPRGFDPVVLDAYLAQRYVAAPATLMTGIRQLCPGEAMVYEGGEVRRWTYWDLRFPSERPGLSPQQWVDRVEGMFRDSVRSHLMADVPYGALLSAGVDSATMVAVLTQEHEADTLTFTADFHEDTFGEGAEAREIAAALGADNYQVVFGPPSVEQFQAIVRHAEEPTADMSMLPMYAVCGLARKHVRVALSGEGADEIFAGYETYQASLASAAYRSIPGPVRAPLRDAVLRLPDSEAQLSWGEKLKRFVRGSEVGPERAHLAWRQICDPDLRRALQVEPAPVDPLCPPGAETFDRIGPADPLERLLYVDFRYYLPNDLLVKADRMSMAHGLEIRVPYLDHRMVELAAAVPPALKLRHGLARKWILRQVARRVLPRSLSRRKRGFNIPLAKWLRGPLRDLATDVLSGSHLRRHGMLQPEPVQRVLDEHLRHGKDRSYELYSLIFVTLWADQMLTTPTGLSQPTTELADEGVA